MNQRRGHLVGFKDLGKVRDYITAHIYSYVCCCKNYCFVGLIMCVPLYDV